MNIKRTFQPGHVNYFSTQGPSAEQRPLTDPMQKASAKLTEIGSIDSCVFVSRFVPG